jgi:hypothetical protein
LATPKWQKGVAEPPPLGVAGHPHWPWGGFGHPLFAICPLFQKKKKNFFFLFFKSLGFFKFFCFLSFIILLFFG